MSKSGGSAPSTVVAQEITASCRLNITKQYSAVKLDTSIVGYNNAPAVTSTIDESSTASRTITKAQQSSAPSSTSLPPVFGFSSNNNLCTRIVRYQSTIGHFGCWFDREQPGTLYSIGQNRLVAGLKQPTTRIQIFQHHLVTCHSFYKPTATSQRQRSTSEHSKQHLKPDSLGYSDTTDCDYGFIARNIISHSVIIEPERFIV
ncbi:hypothetical protein G6011_05357 [Alternaria panax]|uniref:Uncharacterized protein n=1 Tax=Alternaria panax TaxID=48097 RepID=A0AAD4FEX9_9PLEO|nr:hypothetical protein G6011_05357 [Alternaria panax]